MPFKTINSYSARKDDYQKKLLDDRWIKRKKEILDRDNHECQFCFSKSDSLQVHHKQYFDGLEPWEYEDEYLITLCEFCHEQEHQIINKKRIIKMNRASKVNDNRKILDNIFSKFNRDPLQAESF